MLGGMCGRYSIRQPGLFKKLVYFGPYYEDFGQTRIVPNFSIRPSDYVPIIKMHDDDGRLALAEASWGLIPFWTKGTPVVKPINAASETVASKPMFREAFRRRRCLLPMDGFFEPKGSKKLKSASHISSNDRIATSFALPGFRNSGNRRMSNRSRRAYC